MMSARVRLVAPASLSDDDLADAATEFAELLKSRKRKQPKGLDNVFARDPAMLEMSKRFAAAYERTIDKIYKEIVKFIGTKIVPGLKLKKSVAYATHGFAADVDFPSDELVAFASDDTGSPFDRSKFESLQKMALLTPQQLETIQQIISDYHQAFAVGTLGPDVIAADDLQRLIDTGILPQDLMHVFQPAPGESAPEAMNVLDHAYQYGALKGDRTMRARAQKMDYDAFQEHLEKTRDQLSAVERQAMGFARYSAGQHIVGMGDRHAFEVGVAIRDEDAEQRQRYMGTVRRELEDNIDKRQSWRKLASELGHRTQDWSRDLQRVAATEKQAAMQEGAARAMARNRDPDDIRVFKRPDPDACKDCIRLHLTAGPGSPPRIFKMSELTANGTNVGKKRADWQATVYPVHPWCACELGELPEGWGFDEEGTMLPLSQLERSDTRLPDSFEQLRKGDPNAGHMTHRDAVPTDALIVRVADPVKRQVIEAIVAQAPPEIFHRDVGVTLITTDIPRAQNPLDEHDFAYWTANEIRISQTLPIERLPRVLRHELGHSLNVHLLRKFGSVAKVYAWHRELWDLSQEEGFVSEYAEKEPIENAAEVTRLYIFDRPRLIAFFPQQYAFVHRDYADIFARSA